MGHDKHPQHCCWCVCRTSLGVNGMVANNHVVFNVWMQSHFSTVCFKLHLIQKVQDSLFWAFLLNEDSGMAYRSSSSSNPSILWFFTINQKVNKIDKEVATSYSWNGKMWLYGSLFSWRKILSIKLPAYNFISVDIISFYSSVNYFLWASWCKESFFLVHI